VAKCERHPAACCKSNPVRGKPNTRVTSRKVSGCREGFGRSRFRRNDERRTRGHHCVGHWLPHRNFVSPSGKGEVASDLWALGMPLANRLRPKQGSTLRLVTRVLGLPQLEHCTAGVCGLFRFALWPGIARTTARAGSPVRRSARDNPLDCSGASFRWIEIQGPPGALA
jgi:hypothetical protein